MRWEYQATLLVSWETCMQVKKQQLETYMEKLTGSKLRKEYKEAVILSPCLFNLDAEHIMKMPGWMSYKIESRLPGEIPTVSDMQIIPL